MCGLVGIYSSNMFQKHKECLASLLYLDTWRGRDSTGVAALRHNAVTSTLKMTIPGYEFVEGPRLDRHLLLNDFCWIGHNRYGTIGKNIRSNAHPFEILNDDGTCLLVGAHNGTLKNKHVLNDHAQFGTDSEALLDQIARTNVEDTIKQVEGAWALTWYDHVAEELRFLRNKERTLFYAYEEGHKTLIWASEMWMIRVCASRSNIKLEEDKVYSVSEDTLYHFPVPVKSNEDLTCERKGGLVGKTFGFFRRGEWREERTGGNHGSGTQQKTTTETRSQTKTGSSATALAIAEAAKTTSNTQSSTQTPENGEKPQEKKDNTSNTRQKAEVNVKVVPIDSAKTFKGHGGRAYTKRELEDQLANGCSWCELEYIDVRDRFAWLAHEKPICQKCLDGIEDTSKKSTAKTVH